VLRGAARRFRRKGPRILSKRRPTDDLNNPQPIGKRLPIFVIERWEKEGHREYR
jgi:hypothetical protein